MRLRYHGTMIARPYLTLAAAATLPALSGCVSTAASLITAPVRVVSKGADWATTSQSESDRNRGRDLRKREERYGELSRHYRRHSERCDDGDRDACDRARDEYQEMQALRRSLPAESDYDR
jgi:hypothetical protein